MAVERNLANAQSSKGLRRRRGSLEESALIDKDLYEDALEPIFNIPRVTMSGEIDPTELNSQINRFSTSGYKNSDEYEKILSMSKDMYDLKGTFVFGSNWYIPVHFGRQKRSTIDKARKGNVIRFKQNYLCEWIGVSDGGLINISKLIKLRTLDPKDVEFECPRDKKGNYELNEYVIAMDVARSESENNNKTAIFILKIIRSKNNRVRQVRVVNIITPPNGLTVGEQAIIIKRLFYKYGGDLNENKSMVKAIVVDANGVGGGVVDSLLEDQTDNETNNELGCFDTMNTDQRPQVSDSPKVVYALKAQSCNKEMIYNFIDYVETSKLKLFQNFEGSKHLNDDSKISKDDLIALEQQSNQVQKLVDEVSNLKLKITETTTTVQQVVRKIDKDRYSALIMGLFYINTFMDEIIEDTDDEDDAFCYC